MKNSFLTWFKVRAHPDRPEYYRTYLFETVEQLRAWSRGWYRRYGLDNESENDNAVAFCAGAEFVSISENTEVKLPFIGVVCLPLSHLGAGIVSHEFTHAALAWYSNEFGRGWQSLETGDGQEELCVVQGYMVNQFWRKFFRWEKRRGKC